MRGGRRKNLFDRLVKGKIHPSQSRSRPPFGFSGPKERGERSWPEREEGRRRDLIQRNGEWERKEFHSPSTSTKKKRENKKKKKKKRKEKERKKEKKKKKKKKKKTKTKKEKKKKREKKEKKKKKNPREDGRCRKKALLRQQGGRVNFLQMWGGGTAGQNSLVMGGASPILWGKTVSLDWERFCERRVGNSF